MNNRKHFTIGLGIPSILVIFVVLGMVIITMLTYLKEETNSRIVEREIEYTKNYYLADAEARKAIKEKKIETNQSIIIDEKHVLEINQNEDGTIEYQVSYREN